MEGYMHPTGICLGHTEGAVLQGYRLLEEVSGLRYQSSFRAQHDKSGQPARVEFRWHGDDAAAARFHSESERLARFQHPLAAKLYAWGDTGGEFRLFYRICEAIKGDDFHQWQSSHWREGLPLFAQLLEVLAALHSQNLLHDNLERSSLWRTPTGSLKLSSFGRTVAPEVYSCDADPVDSAFLCHDQIVQRPGRTVSLLKIRIDPYPPSAKATLSRTHVRALPRYRVDPYAW